MAKDIRDSEYVKSLSAKRKENPKEFEAAKAKYDSAVKQDADKSQPGTMEMLGNLGRKAKDFVVDSVTDSPLYKAGKMATDSMAPEKKKAGGMCSGGKAKRMATGGTASSRADGCAVKGKTKGRFV